jgi:hypothetical protein
MRWRGTACLGTAVSVAGYWLVGWLVDQPLVLRATLLATLAAALSSLVFATIISRSRFTNGMADLLPPPSASVYETSADARDRRARALILLLLGVVLLLAFDRATGGVGTMAGLVVGLTAAVGVVDLIEARRWSRAEVSQRLRLHILLPARALVGGLTHSSIYALASGDEPSPDLNGSRSSAPRLQVRARRGRR